MPCCISSSAFTNLEIFSLLMFSLTFDLKLDSAQYPLTWVNFHYLHTYTHCKYKVICMPVLNCHAVWMKYSLFFRPCIFCLCCSTNLGRKISLMWNSASFIQCHNLPLIRYLWLHVIQSKLCTLFCGFIALTRKCGVVNCGFQNTFFASSVVAATLKRNKGSLRK